MIKKTTEKKKQPTVIKTGKYYFKDQEKIDLSGHLANRQLDLTLVDDERKSTMSQYKDRIDRIKLDINKYSRSIVDGYEMREFECIVTKDFEAHLKRFKDVRTGNLIKEEPLDPSDYQQELSI